MVKPLPLWLFTAALIALVTLSVSLGPYKIDWAQLTYDVVQNNKTIDTIVFFELRIPRTIMCILTGIALGTGGAACKSYSETRWLNQASLESVPRQHSVLS